jgi:hypothetical protein
MLHRLALPLALALLPLAPACSSGPEPGGEPPAEVPAPGPVADEDAAAPQQAPRPWTRTFLEPAVLIAREVTIEGPTGLRDHVALLVDSLVHDYEVRTLPEGMLQEVTLKPGAGEELVRGHLDRLQIAAEVRLRVLERPGDVPVVVVATGNAVWKTPDGKERSAETLRLVGEEAR